MNTDEGATVASAGGASSAPTQTSEGPSLGLAYPSDGGPERGDTVPGAARTESTRDPAPESHPAGPERTWPSTALLALVRTLALRLPERTPMAVILALARLRDEDPVAYELVMATSSGSYRDACEPWSQRKWTCPMPYRHDRSACPYCLAQPSEDTTASSSATGSSGAVDSDG